MNIILFLLSQCITLFGSTLVQMAIVWYVTMQTASGAWVAAFSVCSYLPQFLISFPGGAWADRYPRRLLIAGADGAAAAVTLLLLAAIPHLSSESLVLGGFLLASALRSLGAGIQTPAVNAVIPQLAPEGQLMRYNGIHAALQSLVQFAAPAAAGLLLSVSTLESILWIDIFTALAGIGILSRIPLPQKKAIKEIPGRTAGENASVSSDIRAGVSYAFIHRQIGALLLLYGFFTFFCVPGGFLSGLYVRRRFGDSYWHLSAAELSGFLGMITGGLLVSIRSGNSRKCPARTPAVPPPSSGSFCCGHERSQYIPSLSCSHVFLWNFHDHDPDFHHHSPSGKNRTLYPGTHFRLDGFHVCRFPSPGNGHIRSSVRPCFPERPDTSLRRSLRCTVCSRPKVDEIKNGIL